MKIRFYVGCCLIKILKRLNRMISSELQVTIIQLRNNETMTGDTETGRLASFQRYLYLVLVSASWQLFLPRPSVTSLCAAHRLMVCKHASLLEAIVRMHRVWALFRENGLGGFVLLLVGGGIRYTAANRKQKCRFGSCSQNSINWERGWTRHRSLASVYSSISV